MTHTNVRLERALNDARSPDAKRIRNFRGSAISVLLLTLLFASVPMLAETTANSFQHTIGGNGPEDGIWRTELCPENHDCLVADMTGDGSDDVVAIDRSSGAVFVAPAEFDKRFGEPEPWHDDFCASAVCSFGDVDGDGDEDVLAVTSFGWRLASSEPFQNELVERTDFSSGMSADPFHCPKLDSCQLGDVDGDGLADLVSLRTHPGDVDLMIFALGSTRFGFERELGPVMDSPCTLADDCDLRVINMNGLARTDLAVIRSESATAPSRIFLSIWAPRGYRPWTVYATGHCPPLRSCHFGDVDGDGRDDLIVFSHSDGLFQLPTGIDTRGDVMVFPTGFRFSDGMFGSERVALGGPFGPLDPVAPQFDNFCFNDAARCHVGDFNGDGKADVLEFLDGEWSTLQGAARVALSTYGRPARFQLDVDRLKVIAHQENGSDFPFFHPAGDEPRVVALRITSRLGVSGTTMVVPTVVRDLGEDVTRGTTLPIPAEVGEVTFPAMPLRTQGNLVPADGSVFPGIDIAALALITIEHDETPDWLIARIMNEVAVRLQPDLDRQLGAFDLFSESAFELDIDRLREMVSQVILEQMPLLVVRLLSSGLITFFTDGLADRDDQFDVHTFVIPMLDRSVVSSGLALSGGGPNETVLLPSDTERLLAEDPVIVTNEDEIRGSIDWSEDDAERQFSEEIRDERFRYALEVFLTGIR